MAGGDGSAGTAEPTTDASTAAAPSTTPTRDPYVDFVRAFAILVVVIWHWVFTIIVWRDGGPHASNPIGTTKGLWALTWLLQVLPLFFFVGGFATITGWRRAQQRGQHIAGFVWSRVMQLLIPSSVLVGFAVGLGFVLEMLGSEPQWVGRAVILVISPLWFLVMYLITIVLTPITFRLHDRFGELVPLFLVGAAAFVDVVRFAWDTPGAAWFNLVIVWALCFQMGYFYDRLLAGNRRTYWVLFWGGLLALFLLVNTGLYPLSMVGVPGEKFSNMAPPTMCIAALLFLQIGAAMLVRPWVVGRLDRPRWSQFSALLNRFAMPIFLWHTTGYAVIFALARATGLQPPEDTTWGWWAERPLWLILPLLVTVPIVLGFERLMEGRSRTPRGAVPDAAVREEHTAVAADAPASHADRSERDRDPPDGDNPDGDHPDRDVSQATR